MGSEAWHAAIHGVGNRRTRLSDWTELKDLMWLLPIKVQAERSHFVFMPWPAGGPPDSPLAKLHVSVFSFRSRPLIRSSSVPDVAGIDGDLANWPETRRNVHYVDLAAVDQAVTSFIHIKLPHVLNPLDLSPSSTPISLPWIQGPISITWTQDLLSPTFWSPTSLQEFLSDPVLQNGDNFHLSHGKI